GYIEQAWLRVPAAIDDAQLAARSGHLDGLARDALPSREDGAEAMVDLAVAVAFEDAAVDLGEVAGPDELRAIVAGHLDGRALGGVFGDALEARVGLRRGSRDDGVAERVARTDDVAAHRAAVGEGEEVALGAGFRGAIEIGRPRVDLRPHEQSDLADRRGGGG